MINNKYKSLSNIKQMLKSQFILVGLLLVTFNLVSFKKTNQILKIDYFGEINLPDEMEIQAGELKNLTNAYGKTLFSNNEKHESLIFQQKGLNSSDANSFKTYARIVIDTYKSEKGTYKNLSESNNLNKDDIDFYLNNFQIQVQNVFPKMKMKLISTNETIISKIGKHFCTKHSFVRQLENSPPVFVEVIRVQNNDRVHLISFSYRIEDELRWKPIMQNVLQSIKIKKF